MKPWYNIALLCFLSACAEDKFVSTTDKTHNDSTLSGPEHCAPPPYYRMMIETPEDALNELKAGNQRFLKNEMRHTNYHAQIEHTRSDHDQHAHSFVLSCLDARIPPEIVFDQGIGNLYVARVAGNIENPDILGSMEFAAEIKGVKLIVVMGHNKCGAVKGAVNDVELGNLTQLVDQIKPSITQQQSYDPEWILDATARHNVRRTMRDIEENSPVIKQLVDHKKVKIVGAFYDVNDGHVQFFNMP